MPSINMIADRREEKRRQEKNIRKLAYGIAAEIGLVVVAISILSVRLAGVTGHLGDLTSQLQRLQPKVDEIQLKQGEIEKIKPKVATLDGAKADTLFWFTNLYAITNSLPNKTWLTSLGTNGGGGNTPGGVSGSDPTMNIAGIALDQATVGETMLRMNDAPSLDHVDLAYVTSQKIGALDTVAFQMNVHLKPEPSAAPQGSDNVKKS